MDPVSRAALAAARLLSDCLESAAPERRGCILGTRGANAFSVATYEGARVAGKRASPLLFAHAGWNVPVALVAGELGCRGFSATVCAGEDSLVEALGWARQALERDRVEWMAVGVTDLVCAESAGEETCAQAAAQFCVLGCSGERGEAAGLTDKDLLSPQECRFVQALTEFLVGTG